MTEIIASLADVAPRYDAVFCDLWGCLHDGKTPFPAAVAALQAFRAQGGIVMLLTNSPRPKPSVIKQLDAMGVPRDAWDDIATSGDAAQYGMLSGGVGRRIHHIGAPKDETFFNDFAEDLQAYAASQPAIERVALKDAEGIICTGLINDLVETPEDYRAQLLLGKTLGLPMLCANPDIVVDMGDKRLWCAGALARDYEEMGGTALYFGKPHPPIYDLARRRLAALRSDECRILCIGDGVNTDVLGGVQEGLDTLFVTGGIDTLAFGTDSSNPNKDLLQAWLDERQLAPSYAIGHLR
ncbi:TIGR01459 family HAD-type hydrolase [Xinfangfangia sp. CPCC 101601]|uniref:TIGR01459 family HAD-type hydrolase n=1 Tax=Pseudogemmobacter lacusdianii TaxID=3069608 RepID=A0ABU0W2S1_9RHOB|nr:TIGR01459 family HAD-type hydrolase [Xinfangfangia sp. CPCC 101601]MDQ2067380.1 TIGR01459 family HAD-type hydrolase [Xinfangfangia sp. CPCC 101601]